MTLLSVIVSSTASDEPAQHRTRTKAASTPECLCSFRRCRSLQVKATSYILVAILCFSFGANAHQRLDGFSPNRHQKMSCSIIRYWWYPHENWSTSIFRDSKSPFFGAKIQTLQFLDGCCVEI